MDEGEIDTLCAAIHSESQSIASLVEWFGQQCPVLRARSSDVVTLDSPGPCVVAAADDCHQMRSILN